MVDFVYDTRCEADLVAVGGISGGGSSGNFTLGQFTRNGFRYRLKRVGRAGDAHGTVDIRAAGQRIADGSADAGGRAAERLDFRRMVVRFVFEQEEPRFRAAVDGDIDFDGAGVDFL